MPLITPQSWLSSEGVVYLTSAIIIVLWFFFNSGLMMNGCKKKKWLADVLINQTSSSSLTLTKHMDERTCRAFIVYAWPPGCWCCLWEPNKTSCATAGLLFIDVEYAKMASLWFNTQRGLLELGLRGKRGEESSRKDKAREAGRERCFLCLYICALSASASPNCSHRQHPFI